MSMFGILMPPELGEPLIWLLIIKIGSITQGWERIRSRRCLSCPFTILPSHLLLTTSHPGLTDLLYVTKGPFAFPYRMCTFWFGFVHLA